MSRRETLAIANQMKREVSGAEYAFLVASLSAPPSGGALHPPREQHIGSHELVESRSHFNEMCVSRHWQFDTLRRAHWSTMMLLAVLGGAPDLD